VNTETKYEAVVRELAAGVPMEEVRAKYEPELHQQIMERRGREEAERIERATPAPATSGYVYVFAAGALVKIGMSEVGVEARWYNIKCSNPLLEPPLFVTGPLGNLVRKVERGAHQALAEHREQGEWFRCDRQLAIDTVKRIVEELQ
jgi:hypothetical protein